MLFRSKQFTETFQFNGIVTSTAEYLRSFTYTPRADCTLRGARIYCLSTTNNIVATLSIPAQIVEDNTIVGGNIPSSLTATATSAATVAGSGGLVTLPNTAMIRLLAGDNIDIIVSTNSATAADVTVTLLLETPLTG